MPRPARTRHTVRSLIAFLKKQKPDAEVHIWVDEVDDVRRDFVLEGNADSVEIFVPDPHWDAEQERYTGGRYSV